MPSIIILFNNRSLIFRDELNSLFRDKPFKVIKGLDWPYY